MSSITQSDQSRNQITSDYDFTKLFLFNNKFRSVSITPSGELEITIGTLIGQVSGVYQVYKSGTSNISFVGIAAETQTIADAVAGTVNLCISGKVNEDELVFDSTDDLDTVVSYIPIRDRIGASSVGIELVTSDELSKFDN